MASKTERARLEEFLYGQISDLATLNETLTAVRCHRPKNAIHTIEDVSATGDNRFWKYWLRNTRFDASKPGTGVPLGRFYSSELLAGRKDEIWLRQLDGLHQNMQITWKSIEKAMKATMEDAILCTENVEFDMRSLRYWKSTQYAERLQAQKDRIKHEMSKSENTD
jgi:hypothetical protein